MQPRENGNDFARRIRLLETYQERDHTTLRDLERWRIAVDQELEDGRETRKKYVPIIESLMTQAQITDAVRKALAERDKLGWKAWSVRAAWAGGFIAFGSLLHQLIGV